MVRVMKKGLKFFIIPLILLAIYIYIVPRVAEMFVSSYPAEYGELRITDEAEVCFVRDETVYVSERSGRANHYIAEGTLVRKGTRIMDLPEAAGDGPQTRFEEALSRLGNSARATGDFICPRVGIVSYYMDGYESKITPENMDKLTYEACSGLEGQSPLELKRERIGAGEPVYKIVDRTKWYLVCFTDTNSEKNYTEGQAVKVELDDNDVDAVVLRVSKKDGRLRVILETDAYYEPFCRKRTAKAFLTTSDGKGLIINNGSITRTGGQKGVYVRDKAGEYEFVPIRVYLTDGGRSLIADSFFYNDKGEKVETVKIHDEILKNAGQARRKQV